MSHENIAVIYQLEYNNNHDETQPIKTFHYSTTAKTGVNIKEEHVKRFQEDITGGSSRF